MNYVVYENMESTRVDIGNYITVYYFKLIHSILKREDFYHDISEYTFLKYLPDYIPFSESESIYNELLKNGINSEVFEQTNQRHMDLAAGFWVLENQSQITIGKIMKPRMNSILNEALTKYKVDPPTDNIIIHFRCADTPFVKMEDYHFQKYSYFKKILDKINHDKQYDITILSFIKHKSNNEEADACIKYSSSLEQYIKTIGYSVSTKSNSDVIDFATMFYAPFVISTSSSFSFISGFFGNGKYYQPSSIHNETEACVDCDDEIVYKNFNLRHNMVTDYLYTDEVIHMLNQ
jgi:hypothetical protein